MSLNLQALGVQNEYSLYLPTSYLNYKYAINITSDYIDLVDVPVINSGDDYNYIRIYPEIPGLVTQRTSSNTINTIIADPVNVSDDFFSRKDAFSICGCTLILMILLVWVFNCLTEFFNKGGLFHI